MATLTDVRIDDATWDAAGRERRAEWRAALDDLLETHAFDLASPSLRLRVTYHEGTTRLDATGEAGEPLATVELVREQVAPFLEEYVGICKQLGKLGNAATPKYEALDIAKRIAHDEAAQELATLCRPLRPDHATCRRLFTLLVTLHVDTTRLVLPHHRY